MIRVSDVLFAAAEVSGLPAADIAGPKRSRELVYWRHRAMFVARQLTGRSYPHIAYVFDDRDHTTIMWGCRKIEQQRQANPSLNLDLARIAHRTAERISARSAS